MEPLKFMDESGDYWKYFGEVDKLGKACGYGAATKMLVPGVKYNGKWNTNKKDFPRIVHEGTWFNN